MLAKSPPFWYVVFWTVLALIAYLTVVRPILRELIAIRKLLGG
jgi:hypothetical protein